MQGPGARRPARPAPAQRIADQRMAARRQVHADLVRAPGVRRAAQRAHAAGHGVECKPLDVGPGGRPDATTAMRTRSAGCGRSAHRRSSAPATRAMGQREVPPHLAPAIARDRAVTASSVLSTTISPRRVLVGRCDSCRGSAAEPAQCASRWLSGVRASGRPPGGRRVPRACRSRGRASSKTTCSAIGSAGTLALGGLDEFDPQLLPCRHLARRHRRDLAIPRAGGDQALQVGARKLRRQRDDGLVEAQAMLVRGNGPPAPQWTRTPASASTSSASGSGGGATYNRA